MRSVWITRTQPEPPGPLIPALQAAGWSVSPLPVLGIEALPLTSAEEQQLLEQIDKADHILWTSAHAVTAVAPFWPERPPQAQLHAVGERTAQVVAETLGLRCLAPPEGQGGQAWVEGMQGRWQAGQHLLLLTGVGGQQDWAAEARQAGLRVQLRRVYRRLPRVCALPPGLPEAVIGSSGEALAALSAILPADRREALQQRPLILAAERLLERARSLGWSGRMQALPALSPAAVLAALEEHR